MYSKPRLLVVIDDMITTTTHSIIFDKLQSTFDVIFKLATDEKLELQRFDNVEPTSFLDHSRLARNEDAPHYNDILGRKNDKYYYDNVMFLTPSVNSFRSKDITYERLLDFFDSGRNIYIGLDETAKSFGRDLLKEFGAELFPQKYFVSGGSQTGVQLSQQMTKMELCYSKHLFEPIRKTIVDVTSNVVFKGTGMKIDTTNEFVFPILQGESTTKVDNPNAAKAFKVKGSDVTLIAGYQSRYNQRVVMSGSVELCSNEFIKATSNGDSTSSSNYQL